MSNNELKQKYVDLHKKEDQIHYYGKTSLVLVAIIATIGVITDLTFTLGMTTIHVSNILFLGGIVLVILVTFLGSQFTKRIEQKQEKIEFALEAQGIDPPEKEDGEWRMKGR